MTIIDTDPKLDFNNVLIRPKRSTINSRADVHIERTMRFINSKRSWTGVPILPANMTTTGTFEVYEVLSTYKMVTPMHKFYTLQDYMNFINNGCNFNGCMLDPNLFMVSCGMSDANYEQLCQILGDGGIICNWICIDIANGYISKFVEYCKKVRTRFPNHIIVAGNVVTREMVEELILNGGVDVVKIGIGPGSACTTRKKTGVGMPQLSAVMECADAAHGVGGHIVSDGGITCPGDMSKAFCAGGDFVMMGGQFAGHDENPGEIIEEINKETKEITKYKMFYGMSSSHAMKTHYGKHDTYRSSEGKVVKVVYKGALSLTVDDFLGGLRSTCTYINASHIKNMPKCTTFVIVSQQINNFFT